MLKGNTTNVDYLDGYIYATKDKLQDDDSPKLNLFDYNNFYDHISKSFEKNL